MAAHRYWRLVCKRSQSRDNVGIGELQMRTSIGGTNVATGGTPSASSFQGTYTAAKAFDGLTVDTGTGNAWASNGGYSGGTPTATTLQWLQYDFGSGNSKDIQEIVLFCPGTGGLHPGNMVVAFDLQWSDDGAAWTTQRSIWIDFVADPWTASSSKIIDVRALGAIDIHNYTLFTEVPFHPYVTPGQPVAPIYDPNTEEGKMKVNDCHRFAGDLGRPGLYKIAGTTTVLGNPAPRRVRLYNQFEGRIYAEQYTAPDGLFEFRNLEIGPWTVVGVDDTGTQNGVIYSHVNAVPM